MIYKLRGWLRDDDNEIYVLEDDRDKIIEKLGDHEDWLYDEGAHANYTTFEKMFKVLKTDFDKFEKRKSED